MTDTTWEDKSEFQADVVVIGGGLAGQATAIHLSRGGLRVVCLEPREGFNGIVGESLDWSAPQLFAQLGLSMNDLVDAGAATWKRHITVTAPDGSQKEYLPGEWLANRPWNVEVRTLHLDRCQVHKRMQQASDVHGVRVLHERAVAFEIRDRRILSVETSEGRCVRAAWIIDASGAAASVLGREFNLTSAAYGPRKVALWAHFPTEDWVEGTTLYMLSAAGEYMEWLWEIPIRPGVSSIGYIAPGSKIKTLRAHGQTNAELLSIQMKKFGRLSSILKSTPPRQISATSFLCRTYSSASGPNWFIVGEAASQSDPITGNGVTAALRHAAEASALICRYQKRGTIPALVRIAYDMRVTGLGRYFNSLIEKFFYQPVLRDQLGLFATARTYTVPAWLTNLLYSRVRPRRILGTTAFCAALVAVRVAAWGLFRLSRLLHSRSSKGRKFVDQRMEDRRALQSPR